MVIHYFTLLALCEELSPRLAGKTIQEIYTQQKSELLITFVPVDGREADTLCVSIEPRRHYVAARTGFRRAKRNSSDLFPGLSGAQVASLTLLPLDRVLTIECSDGRRCVLQLYDSARSNILLVDGNNVVIEAFKNGKILNGTEYAPPQPAFDHAMLDAKGVLIGALRQDPSRALFSALKSAIPMLGTIYAREVLSRAGIGEDVTAGSCADEEIVAVADQLHVLIDSFHLPSPVIYSTESGSSVFSIIPLVSFEGISAEPFTSVNEAVLRMIARLHRESTKTDDRNRFFDRIKVELEKSGRAARLIRADIEDGNRGEEYTAMGKLLMSNLSLLAKGMNSVELHDAVITEQRYTITLDPKLGPVENAERYFDKSKKSKARKAESIRRLQSVAKTQERLGDLLNDLHDAESAEGLKAFTAAHKDVLRSMHLVDNESQKEAPPFRVFTVAGGYEVWVGKSSANNDLLTMKYAKPNDLWFHVRGASGSHTVLKVRSGDERPPREAIRQAAAIAAFYSKMRKAGQVPVAYCQRKYVRKPKGAAPGAVSLEREEVVFAQPKLPS